VKQQFQTLSKIGIVATTLFIIGCPIPKIPKPDPAGAANIPPVENSTIGVTITANLAPLRTQLDGMIPRVIVEDGPSDPACVEYGVYKRQPVGLTANGNRINVNVGVVYRVKYALPPFCWPSVSCGYGEPSPRADVIPSSALRWHPNWHLESQTATDANMLDACNMSAVNIDVRDFIKGKLGPKLQEVSNTIDQSIPAMTNIRPAAERGWQRLQQPFLLAPNVWLKANPIEPRASSLDGNGQNMSFSVGLVAQPQIFVQQQAPPASQGNLPQQLNIAPISNRFHIAIDGILSYGSASQIASTNLLGKEFKYGRYKAIITAAEIYGSAGKLVLALTIRGSVKGTVYFIGTPTYVSDAQGERIVVSDLDYTLETRNILAKFADWLLHCNFVELLREQAVFPLEKKITDLRNQLEAGLNQDFQQNISIRGHVESLRVAGVYIDSNRVVVRGIADGTAELTVR